MKFCAALPIFLTLVALTSGHNNDEYFESEELVDEIYDLMAILREFQLFELGSIPSFFPVEKEFFLILDHLFEINVSPGVISNLRNGTLSEVRGIQQMFCAHGADLSKLVELLAETAHLVQLKDKDVARLRTNFRSIVKSATGLVSNLMAIVERIEFNAARFQYKLERAVQNVRGEAEMVLKIRQQAVAMSSSYSNHYEEMYDLLEKAHANFDQMLPALRLYINYVTY